MEFMLDTANIADIKKFADMLPIAGVTSNPSIVKKEGKIDFFQHMKDIRGIKVTATSIYTKFQAYLAIAAGADYIAPYFNRMENLNIDPRAAIFEMAEEIARTNSETKILAASFKNVGQVNAALENGSQAATMGVDIIQQALAMPSIAQAVTDFTGDWEAIFGEGTTIADL